MGTAESRIVIVEEERALRSALCSELRHRGIDAVETDQAEHAAQLIAEGAAMVICDYHVRLDSGEGLLRWVRREHPLCVGILWTSQADIHLAVDALEAGLVSRFILQSWEMSMIGGAVAMALESGKGRSSTPADGDTRPAAPASALALGGGSGTVLLVEDDNRERSALERLLSRYGMNVLPSADGAGALRQASTSSFDVALVDIVLPKVDGIEVIRFLKANRPSTVVVAVSGLTNRDARDEAFAAGADDFVNKPYDSKTLIKRLDGYLQMSRIRAAARESGERAERVELYAREMSSLLAHDLRNGFAAVELNLGMLELNEEMPELVKTTVASVKRILRRMTALADNLTQVDLLAQHKLTPRRSLFDIDELIRQVAEIHRPAVRADEVTMRIDCEGPLRVNVDRVLVERLLHNLLNNAVRYVSDGGTIRVAARVVRGEERTLVIEVGNSGAPLPKSVTTQVFTPGGIADRNSRTGLGLYFCRLVCAAHGGSIAVEPRGDLRANIVLRLPMVDRDAPAQ